MNLYYYQTDIGRIGIAANGESITNLFFETDAIPHAAEIYETVSLKEAARQLEAYLNGATSSRWLFSRQAAHS